MAATKRCMSCGGTEELKVKALGRQDKNRRPVTKPKAKTLKVKKA